MFRLVSSALAVCAIATLAACDTGPYTPSQHRSYSDASTGSLFSGADTGAHDGTTDPGLSANGAGGPGGAR